MYLSSFGYHTHSTSCDNCGIDAVSNQLLTPHLQYRAPSPIYSFRLPQFHNLCTESFHHSSIAIPLPWMRRREPAPPERSTTRLNQSVYRFDCIVPCDDTCFIHLHHNTRYSSTPTSLQQSSPSYHPQENSRSSFNSAISY